MYIINGCTQISGLEPLTNLRVLMLGKNRIRRIEGLQRCCRLSVLDLHGNRINQVTQLLRIQFYT
jgi:leucine-rich repeat-containing protein 49